RKRLHKPISAARLFEASCLPLSDRQEFDRRLGKASVPEVHSEIRNFAMSRDAVGRPSLLMFVDHSRHCAATFANASCTVEITRSCVSAIVPEFVSTIKRAFPSSCPGMM